MGSTTVTRRRLAGMAAALAPLVLRMRASAAPYDWAPDNTSKADFKRWCQGLKGATWDEGKYSTACTNKGGDTKVCDENGKNCTWHPAAQAPAPGPFGDPLGGSEPLPVFTEQPAAEPAGAAPKAKGKKSGKRRKR